MIDLRAMPLAGQYKMLAADPPWHFKSRTAIKSANPGSRRDAERHYATMSLDAIKALPVGEVAARDAHLLLWTTGPFLAATFEVIEAWGFRYSAIAFAWFKLKRSIEPRQLRLVDVAQFDFHVGLGHTTRHNVELCLLARRGSPRRESRKVREVIISPLREHSRKPEEFYERAEEYAVGPRLELFARQRRPGWDSWGNEVEKFAEAAE